MTPKTALSVLRLFLAFSGVAWGVSFVGVFAPWDTAADLLSGLGLKTVQYDPMLDYWLRMASAAFGLVGILFFVLACWPAKHRLIIPFFGGLMLFEGGVLLVHGLRLNLPAFPFYADTGACLIAGLAILSCHRLAFRGASALDA